MTDPPGKGPVERVLPVADGSRGFSSAKEYGFVGRNPLVKAAWPLLLLTVQLRSSRQKVDVPLLRRRALQEIDAFSERARTLGADDSDVKSARVVLCGAIDEAAASAVSHNEEDGWIRGALVAHVDGEASASEVRFPSMLMRVSQDSGQNIDLVELCYLCLALGSLRSPLQTFTSAEEQLGQIKRELHEKIRRHRRQRSPNSFTALFERPTLAAVLSLYIRPWAVGVAAGVLVTLMYAYFRLQLGVAATPVHVTLARFGIEDFSSTSTAVTNNTQRLKPLLAAEEATGALRIEEDGGRTLITLLADDLFSSGSATPNPAHEATLRRVADALNSVPGRVLVKGHTDNQPVTSLRYRDNFELSRERALAISKALQGWMDNSARIESIGVGASEPRYRPESTSVNRARNRRVEIVHVREGLDQVTSPSQP